jgi:hypothetical protein
LATLDTVLGPNAPDAAARERLLGIAASALAPASALRARHDWVLFRRPVDARCPGPVAVPPTPVQPPVQPPAVAQGVKAWVLRLQGPSGRISVDDAVTQLQAGSLPSTKLSTLGDAGMLSFMPGATTPEQSDAQLQAAFASAGLGPTVRAVALHGNTGTSDAERQARYIALVARLGGGSAALQLRPLTGTLSPALPVGTALGSAIYLVEPPVDPPPPPPLHVVNHRQRVLLLRQRATPILTRLLASGLLWESQADELLRQLNKPDLSLGFFEVDAEVRLNPSTVHLFDDAGAGLNSLNAAVRANGGMGSSQLTTLLRATDDSSDRRSEAEIVSAAMYQHVNGGPGAQVRVVACNPSPAELQAQYQALTVMFAKN